MDNEHEEYVLGPDVTPSAAARERRGTTVLSVRLAPDELAQLESVSRATGRTISQIVREALSSCIQLSRYAQPSVTLSVEGQSTVTTGTVLVSTKASKSETLALGVA
jgi:predicted transcriptional regulator